jgi:hypothetical protein
MRLLGSEFVDLVEEIRSREEICGGIVFHG